MQVINWSILKVGAQIQVKHMEYRTDIVLCFDEVLILVAKDPRRVIFCICTRQCFNFYPLTRLKPPLNYVTGFLSFVGVWVLED